MATLAFDTLQFARRLKEAGVPDEQAEVQAELMAQAFGFYVDNLVTRDYLDARLDARFTQQDARIDERFSQVGQRIDVLTGELTRGFVEIKGQFHVTHTILALLSAAILIPTLARWFGG